MTRKPAKTKVLLFSFAVSLACVAWPASVLPLTDSSRASVAGTQTFLVAADVMSAADLEHSAYDVIIAIKLKLEAVGYGVVLDAQQPHDAVLLVEYDEMPGREYPKLEVGTKIVCRLTLYHPSVGKLYSYAMQAESAWPRPFGSLYWDAVQNLEENAYYYYLGELTRGSLASQADVIDVFNAVLREPPLFQSLDGSDNIVTSRMAANQNARLNAIRELAKRRDSRSLETLWHLAWQGNTPERKAAVAAIGDIGDPASVERLSDLASAGGPVGTAAAAALARIRAGQEDVSR